MTNPPTGWHPDPEDPSRERWWDGASGQWLDHTRAASGPPPNANSSNQVPHWAQTPSKTTRLGTQIRSSVEHLWKKFRALPPRKQAITAAAVVVAFVVIGAIGAISERTTTKEREAATSRSSAPPATSLTSESTKQTPRTTVPTTTTPAKPPTTTAAAKPPPPTYPGARDNDAVANSQGEVEVRGLTTTIGLLRRIPAADFDGPRLCSDLKLENRGSDTEFYDSSDFTIQYPSGNEKGTVLVYDNDVHTGNLVAGGQTLGQVCFVDRQEPGQHLVLWNRTDLSDFSTPRRGVWILN